MGIGMTELERFRVKLLKVLAKLSHKHSSTLIVLACDSLEVSDAQKQSELNWLSGNSARKELETQRKRHDCQNCKLLLCHRKVPMLRRALS